MRPGESELLDARARRLGIRLPGAPDVEVGASRPDGSTRMVAEAQRTDRAGGRSSRDREDPERREGTPGGARSDSGRGTVGAAGLASTFSARRRQEIADIDRRLELHARVWTPLLLNAMSHGRPQIDPSLLHGARP